MARAVARAQGISVTWSSKWDARFDRALQSFPALAGISHDQYRALVGSTPYLKRHALVTDRGLPIAVISLRRRQKYWEPVTVQAINGCIAPAVSPEALGRALNALGVDIRVPSGLGPWAERLGARRVWTYPIISVNLQSDYEAYWLENQRKHHKHVASARKRCAKYRVVHNGEGDIEWTVNTWMSVWESDKANETVAGPDRIALWKTLPWAPAAEDRLAVHSVVLYDGGQRIAGAIQHVHKGTALGQCMVRLPDDRYSKAGVGTRIIDLAMQWAKENEVRSFDFGGGHDYKALWGPTNGVRRGLIVRSRLLDLLARAEG